MTFYREDTLRAFRLPKSDIDKKVIKKDEPLRRRTRWAINYVAAEYGLTNVKMAESVGMKEATFSNYRLMNASPKIDFVNELCKTYSLNAGWLFRGEGEPFPGARAKYPEVCGAEQQAPEKDERTLKSTVDEKHPNYGPADVQGFSIGDDLALAAKVLESQTHYATALHLNIRSFAAGIHDISIANQVGELQKRLAEMEGVIKKLQEEHRALQAENKELRKEVNRLKATYENPEGGAGSLTDIGS